MKNCEDEEEEKDEKKRREFCIFFFHHNTILKIIILNIKRTMSKFVTNASLSSFFPFALSGFPPKGRNRNGTDPNWIIRVLRSFIFVI